MATITTDGCEHTEYKGWCGPCALLLTKRRIDSGDLDESQATGEPHYQPANLKGAGSLAAKMIRSIPGGAGFINALYGKMGYDAVSGNVDGLNFTAVFLDHMDRHYRPPTRLQLKQSKRYRRLDKRDAKRSLDRHDRWTLIARRERYQRGGVSYVFQPEKFIEPGETVTVVRRVYNPTRFRMCMASGTELEINIKAANTYVFIEPLSVSILNEVGQHLESPTIEQGSTVSFEVTNRGSELAKFYGILSGIEMVDTWDATRGRGSFETES